MTQDRRTSASRDPLEEPGWRRYLRGALDDVLLDVRVSSLDEEPGAIDFLIVHPAGLRREAIGRWAKAIVAIDDVPLHDVMTADEQRAAEDQFDQYVSVKS